MIVPPKLRTTTILAVRGESYCRCKFVGKVQRGRLRGVSCCSARRLEAGWRYFPTSAMIYDRTDCLHNCKTRYSWYQVEENASLKKRGGLPSHSHLPTYVDVSVRCAVLYGCRPGITQFNPLRSFVEHTITLCPLHSPQIDRGLTGFRESHGRGIVDVGSRVFIGLPWKWG